MWNATRMPALRRWTNKFDLPLFAPAQAVSSSACSP
jgi:hypothetical protein